MPLCISAKISNESFYVPALRTVWNTMATMYSHGTIIDALTVQSELGTAGLLDKIGGCNKFNEWMDEAGTAAHSEYHIEIIRKAELRRIVITISRTTEQSLYDTPDDDLAGLLATVQADWCRIDAGKPDTRSLSEIASGMIDEWEKPRETSNQIRWPLESMNRHMGTLTDELVYIASRESVGKCLAPGTNILMFDGTYKAVEYITKGDVLMGPDSRPRNVLSTTCGIGDMYEVWQRYGESYLCNADHLIALECPGEWQRKRYRPSRKRTVRADEFNSLSRKARRFWMGYKSDALEFAAQSVPIDPHWFGLWIGDGSRKSTHITAAEQEIVEYIHEHAERIGMFVSSYAGRGCRTYRTVSKRGSGGSKGNVVRDSLKELGVWEHKSIPACYLVNSVSVRRELLAGLLDSDGYITRPGSAEICSIDENLAKQYEWLCRSLGLRAVTRHKNTTCQIKGYKGHAWRVSISGDMSQIPCLLPRKRTGDIRRTNCSTKRGQITVAMKGRGPYFGFTLDGDGLFILEDFTVTHNTAFAVQMAVQLGFAGVHVAFASLESKKDKLVQRMIAMIGRCDTLNMRFGMRPNARAFDFERGREAAEKIKKLNITIEDVGMNTDQIRAFAQMQQSRGAQLLIIDNMKHIRPKGSVKGKSVVEQFRELAQGIKWIRDDLSMPVIVLHHLSKTGDVSWSDDIRRDADVLLFLTPNEEESEPYTPQNKWKGRTIIDVDCEKAREGRRGYTLKTEFIPHHQTFVETGPQPEEENTDDIM